ncbi:ATP-binding cassette domain-containing protein [Pelagimonas varians]|uniref:Toxin RTX-I translocation ATP-binding protein n=2 Tax=Pelagimonas varians TaxID=696760 RepID=A0A238L6N3_9RHOB|nr:ABC-type bacteriocin/lantibiotic exporter with double-glycine peptidase domain [Pelagimonas varians]SMX50042.1 Toxin RTX-I translocation ATP-binding protein [Pelagimonas varians]
MMSDATGFLQSVLKHLDGRHSGLAIEAAFGGFSSSLSDMARASNLIGVDASIHKGVPASWSDGHDGALIARDGTNWTALVRRDGDLVSFPENDETGQVRPPAGPLLYLRMLPEADASKVTFANISSRARGSFVHVAWQSLVINLCALAVPFFTMAVYDRVLGGGAAHSLPALLSGAVIVLITMLAMRRVRSGLAATEYASLSGRISTLLAGKALRSPISNTAGSSGSAIVAKIRQGERAADLFASANIAAIYDAPFILLTFAALVIVGGGMAIIPAIYLVLFFGFGLLMNAGTGSRDPFAVRQSQRRTQMIGELVDANGAIQRAGLGEKWLQRFDATMRSSARDTHRFMTKTGSQSAIATTLGSGTALVTLVVGIDLALNGHLSAGTLIGTMLLTWRITGPAQSLFLAIPRLKAIRSGWTSLEAQLRAPTVGKESHLQIALEPEAPAVAAQGLFYRYEAGQPPAVTGVSFDVAPGSIVVVMGPNGSGKSTLLQLIAGDLRPQSGHLTLNGRQMSQYDPDEIDARCAYMGGDKGVWLELSSIKPGVGFSAEAHVERAAWSVITGHDSRFFVLDDPLAATGKDAVTEIENFINETRGKATIFLATHDTELAALADIAIVLDAGNVVYCGPVQTETPEADASAKEKNDG